MSWSSISTWPRRTSPAAPIRSGARRAARAGGLGIWLLLASSACQLTGEPPLVPPRPNPDLVQRGALLFLSPELSGDGRRSCDTCHPGGETDGRIYRQGAEAPAGSPGARDVPTLRGLWQTPPYLRDGSISSLREVIARMLEVEMRGGRLEETDLAALEAYLFSIPPFDRGRIKPDGTPIEPVTLAARRGFEFFKRAKCVECHPPPVFARRRRFDVGTGMQLQPPSLRGVASSPPYGHDGRWPTLEEAVRAMLAARGIDYSERELSQLIRYLELI